MSKIQIVVEPLQRPADPGALIACTERTALQAPSKLCRPRPFLCNDVDDAADRIGAVEPALRPAHNFDPFDVPGQDMLEIEGAGGWVGRVDAVDENFGLVRICTAYEDRGEPSWAAVLEDIQSWNIPQGIGQRPLLLTLDILFGDYGDAAAHLVLRCRQTGRRHH